MRDAYNYEFLSLNLNSKCAAELLLLLFNEKNYSCLFPQLQNQHSSFLFLITVINKRKKKRLRQMQIRKCKRNNPETLSVRKRNLWCSSWFLFTSTLLQPAIKQRIRYVLSLWPSVRFIKFFQLFSLPTAHKKWFKRIQHTNGCEQRNVS